MALYDIMLRQNWDPDTQRIYIDDLVSFNISLGNEHLFTPKTGNKLMIINKDEIKGSWN